MRAFCAWWSVWRVPVFTQEPFVQLEGGCALHGANPRCQNFSECESARFWSSKGPLKIHTQKWCFPFEMKNYLSKIRVFENLAKMRRLRVEYEAMSGKMPRDEPRAQLSFFFFFFFYCCFFYCFCFFFFFFAPKTAFFCELLARYAAISGYQFCGTAPVSKAK